MKNSRIGKDGTPLQFWVIRCILARDNRDLPALVPKQRDLGMNGGAAVIKTIHEHLERERAHGLDPVIDQYPEGKNKSFVQVVLELLYTGLAE